MSVVTSKPASPFKGLAAFEDSELDALFFFGRDREREVLAANLLASRLTILYGESGVGKTSLLRAAVVRDLRAAAPDAYVVVLGSWSEPVDPEVIEEVREATEAYVILDQFEEYFLYLGADGRRTLLDELPDLLYDSRANVLISLREDSLARLDALTARIPNIFGNHIRLDHLDRVEAHAAILGPIQRWNELTGDEIEIEPALVDAVVDEVAVEGRGRDRSRVEAPYLQLVLERIWDAENAMGSDRLRLRTLRGLGGARTIVRDHLEHALAALTPTEQEVAARMFGQLVTPSGTKIAHRAPDLAEYADVPEGVLRGVLATLTHDRIVHSVDGSDRYEIFHDVLAEPILGWRRERQSRAALAVAARRHRRLAMVAGASIALAAAMAGLAVYAFSQRSEASHQRHVALAQTEVALAQQRIAEQQSAQATKARAVAIRQRRKADAARAAAISSAARARASAARARASEAEARASEGRAKQSAAAATAALHQAERSKRFAITQENNARRQEVIARAGQLVATAEADLTLDPVKSVRAAVAASALESSGRVENAMRDALLAARARAIFPGGGGPVVSATFNPDGSLVALGAQSGLVRLYSVTSHTLVHELHTASSVDVVRFSPDGTLLAVGTKTHGLLLYDVRTGTVARTLAHTGAVLDASFAGPYLVTGSSDSQTRVWDPATGELVHALAGASAAAQLAVSPDDALVGVLARGQSVAHVYDIASGSEVAAVQQPGEVTSLAFSPNGAYLVTTGRRNGFVWDTKTWALLHTLTGHSAAIDDVAFTASGLVLTASIDASARLWDPATGESLFTMIGQHQQKILAVAASPTTGAPVTASGDATARIWYPLGAVPILLAGHTEAVTGVEFAPSGSLLLTWSVDGTARLWDTRIAQLQTVGTHAASVTGVSFDPRGKVVLSAGADGTAKLWRGSTATTLAHGGAVVRARFVGGGAQVLTAGDDGAAKLWRTADGALLHTYEHGAPVAAALPIGDGILTAGSDGMLKSWTTKGVLRWTVQQGASITSADVSPDGGTIAAGSIDGTVRLWGRDGRALATLVGEAGPVDSVTFSPSGALVATAGADDRTFVWDVATGKLRYAVGGHPLGVTTVAFSPDGKTFATAGVDGDVRLWSSTDGRQLHRLGFHVSTVSQVSFSPDGRWVVSAGPTAAGIWQVSTGNLVYALRGAKGTLSSAAFAPDSRRIVVGDAGGGITTFDCVVCGKTAGLRAQARALLAGLK